MAYTVVDFPAEYFNTKLYTGTGATQSITGVGFQPDWVWIKERSASASDHNLSDAVRGAGKALFSNTTGAEYDYGTGTGGNLRSFDSDGFSLGTATQTNANGTTFVSWNWDANGAGVSNTSGTISSTVSANTTSGFSIVSYTGNGTTNATVGHGLGVTPKMIITKNRSNATATNWTVYHVSLSTNNQITLNQTDAQNLPSPLMVTTVGSSTYTLGSSRREINQSSDTYIAYCFAEVKGYSKFGSYVGNGSTSSGTFIYTGFKPAFVMVKNTTNGNTFWVMVDSVRKPANPANANLYANDAEAEGATDYLHFFSNGFSPLKSASSWVNESGSTYIYMAFAENPFVSSTGIPTTAR